MAAVLVLLGSGAVTGTTALRATPAGQTAVGMIAGLCRVPEDGGIASADAAGRVYQVIYWLAVAAKEDLSPERTLRQALSRSQIPEAEAQADERQLLTDWRIAGLYGLLTPENLLRLRAGQPPTATDGRFRGQPVAVGPSRLGATTTRGHLGCYRLYPARAGLSADPATEAGMLTTPAQVNAPPPKGPTTAGTDPFQREEEERRKRNPPRDPDGGTRPVPAKGPPSLDQYASMEKLDVPLGKSCPVTGKVGVAVLANQENTASFCVYGDGPDVVQSFYYDASGRRVSLGSGDPAPPGTKLYRQTLPSSRKWLVSKDSWTKVPKLDGGRFYLIYQEGNRAAYFLDDPRTDGSSCFIVIFTL